MPVAATSADPPDPLEGGPSDPGRPATGSGDDGQAEGQAQPSKRQRVPALAPDDRRAALIVATIPLLKQFGANVSTRMIADAAGVAEGTIFGVFRDKASLIDAAISSAFDPTPVIQALRGISPEWDLRARLVAAAEILRAHLSGFGPLLVVIRSVAMAGGRTGRVDVMAARYLILYEVAALIEPDTTVLRRSPSTVARLLLSMIMASRDGFDDLATLDSHEIVSLLLDGLLVRTDALAAEHPTLEFPC